MPCSSGLGAHHRPALHVNSCLPRSTKYGLYTPGWTFQLDHEGSPCWRRFRSDGILRPKRPTHGRLDVSYPTHRKLLAEVAREILPFDPERSVSLGCCSTLCACAYRIDQSSRDVRQSSQKKPRPAHLTPGLFQSIQEWSVEDGKYTRQAEQDKYYCP